MRFKRKQDLIEKGSFIMIGTPRPVGVTKFAVDFPQENLAIIYQSGYNWLDDGKFSKFPEDSQVFPAWSEAWEYINSNLNFDEDQLYWGLMLDELTIVYGASTEKETLLEFGFEEIPDDWCGYLFHEGDRLRREKMVEMGINYSEI